MNIADIFDLIDYLNKHNIDYMLTSFGDSMVRVICVEWGKRIEIDWEVDNTCEVAVFKGDEITTLSLAEALAELE